MNKAVIFLMVIIKKLFIYTMVVLYYPLVVIWTALRYLNPKYLYCRFKHGKSIIRAIYELSPFGMGGGHNSYYWACPTCKRKHWELTTNEFKNWRQNEQNKS